MICFYEKDGLLIKVYDQSDDLQILTNVESQKERWFTKWSDYFEGSVYSAIGSVIKSIYPKRENPVFDINDVQWLKK